MNPVHHRVFFRGVQAAGPGDDGGFDLVFGITEELLKSFAPPNSVGGEIPIPDRVGGGASGQGESL
jgi:hypothetical protein